MKGKKENNKNENINLKDLFVSSLKTLFSYVYDPAQNLTTMAAVHLIGAVEVVINTVTPIELAKWLINTQLSDHEQNTSIGITQTMLLVPAALLTANIALPRVRGLLTGSVRRNVQKQISLDMVKRVYDGPLDEHIAEPTGDLVATISKNYAETEKVMPVFVELANTSFEALLKSAILYRSCGWVGITPIAVFLPYFLVAFGGELIAGLTKLKNQSVMVEAFDKLLETVNNYTVAQQNGNSERELSKLSNKVLKLEESFAEVNKVEEITALLLAAINRFGFLASLASIYYNPPLAHFWVKKDALILAYYFLTSALKFEALPPKINSLLTGIAGAFLVDKFFKTHPVLKDPDIPVKFKLNKAPCIEFKGVNFSYDKDKKGLANINFIAKAGSTVVIMGPTGCGKSTVLKILQRFYDNYTGEILVDGVNIKRIQLQEYRRYISVVSQETNLLDDTLLENIHYSDPSVDEQTVFQAARFAKLDLSRDRFFAKVEKGGANFSGGEKQRVLIARALVKGGAGYIFLGDEITSALDQQTSREIHEVLEHLGQDVTKILVTHDPNLVRNADLIICMKDGLIVQQGTYEELINTKGGDFYNLYQTMCEKLGVSIEAIKLDHRKSHTTTELTRWAGQRRNSYFFPSLPPNNQIRGSNAESSFQY